MGLDSVSGASESRASRLRTGETIVEFSERIARERAAKDPAYAERLRMQEVEAQFNTGIKTEDGGTEETKGRKMPWHKWWEDL